MTETVAAVVVTYNRRQLLTRCLDGLLAQTKPVDKIILIDNASTDGTPKMLEDCDYLNSPVIDYVRLPENIGGAGGFYEGVKLGYEAGYDWLWLMDDDGCPELSCLEELFSSPCVGRDRIAGPAVVDINNKERLAFPYVRGREKVLLVESLERLYENDCVPGVNPFNGILLHKNVIGKIGLPMKEMFIWGDEIEYIIRARESGINSFSVVRAKFYHPAMKVVRKEVLWGAMGSDIVTDTLRLYCLHRNRAYIYKKYKGNIWAITYVVFVFGKKFSSGNMKDAFLVARASIHGYRNKWGGEKSFIKR